jgi:hypothetical protein
MLSAFHPIATEQQTQFYVGFVPISDMAAIGKVQRIASRSDCAAAALCFRGELVLPNILIYAPTAGWAVALRRRVEPLQGETTKMAGSSLTPAKVQPNDSCR